MNSLLKKNTGLPMVFHWNAIAMPAVNSAGMQPGYHWKTTGMPVEYQ